VAVFLLRSAVRSRLFVNPILFGVDHSRAALGNRARRSSLVESARERTVTEGLNAIAAPLRVPPIDDHLDRHSAAPDAASAEGF